MYESYKVTAERECQPRLIMTAYLRLRNILTYLLTYLEQLNVTQNYDWLIQLQSSILATCTAFETSS